MLDLVRWAEQQEGRQLPYSLIGHSGRGQFLSRVAALPTKAGRIAIANPSTYVAPSLEVDAPYGFGKIAPQRDGDESLRRYLAQPITICLGQDDIGDKNRNDGPEARAQGRTRYERGINIFQMARSLAECREWPFGWRLMEAPGIGHSARRMFAAEEALEALRSQ